MSTLVRIDIMLMNLEKFIHRQPVLGFVLTPPIILYITKDVVVLVKTLKLVRLLIICFLMNRVRAQMHLIMELTVVGPL